MYVVRSISCQSDRQPQPHARMPASPQLILAGRRQAGSIILSQGRNLSELICKRHFPLLPASCPSVMPAPFLIRTTTLKSPLSLKTTRANVSPNSPSRYHSLALERCLSSASPYDSLYLLLWPITTPCPLPLQKPEASHRRLKEREILSTVKARGQSRV